MIIIISININGPIHGGFRQMTTFRRIQVESEFFDWPKTLAQNSTAHLD